MMKIDKSISALMLGFAVLLSGCASDFSGDRYESATVGEVSRTDIGTVISMRKIEIKPEDSSAGTALGAVGGGIAGAMFGGGNAKFATAAAGAVLGGVAGNAIASRAEPGMEYTIKLDSGAVITIAQGLTPAVYVGQRVHVINSNRGRGRVVPA